MRGSYLLCLCFVLKLQLGEPAHTITHRARTKARVGRKTFQMTDKLEGESTEFQEENSSRRREPTAVKRPKNDKPRRVTYLVPRSTRKHLESSQHLQPKLDELDKVDFAVDYRNYDGGEIDDLVDYHGPDGGEFTDYSEEPPPLPPPGNGRPPPQIILPPQLSRYPPVPLFPPTGVPSPVPPFFPRNVHPGFPGFPGMPSPYPSRPVPQFQPQLNPMTPQRLNLVSQLVGPLP